MKLILEGIQKNFGAKKVLKNISFEFEEGKIYGLLGRNGAGKTTLFNCMNEDIPCDKGYMQIAEDENIRKLNPDDIGYVLSTPQVPDFLTGREFLNFFIDINRNKLSNLKSIDEYFDLVGIEREDRDRLLKDYSHGMKNKMMMLVHIILNPKILLLDEPLTSFDVVTASHMKQLLKNMSAKHILIFSTHIMELALDLCDEIVLLNHGELERIERRDMDRSHFEEIIISKLKGETDE